MQIQPASRRCREKDCDALSANQPQPSVRIKLGGVQDDRRTESHGEDQQSSEPVGESKWWMTSKTIVWMGVENLTRVGIRNRQKVGVRMYCTFWLAGCPGGICDNSHIVGIG